VKGFQALVNKYSTRIGAIVMEPIRNEDPTQEFRDAIHTAVQQQNAPLVIDEVTAGFRLCVGGAHLQLGWKPDIAVFAKGMSNGHPMAAIIGRREIMEGAQRSFISSTYWTDRTGPAAALATVRKMQRDHVPDRLAVVGEKVQAAWRTAAESAGLPVHIGGIKPLSHITFETEDPLLTRTVFNQEMLDRGFLSTGAVYCSMAHTDTHIAQYAESCFEIFQEISNLIAVSKLESRLRGPKAHSGFRRLN
jgi:glutamate-1-semialdehyde aminotransferase